jgi:hypothetical protein
VTVEMDIFFLIINALNAILNALLVAEPRIYALLAKEIEEAIF